MLRKLAGLFKKDNGVVAIEFAMLSLPFFMMLMGTVEISLFFAASIVLEGGAAEAARTIRTGEAQNSGDPETMFSDLLCDQVEDMIDCSKIKYEVIAFGDGDFQDADDYAPQYDANGDLVPQGFGAGGTEEVVLIRAFYRYEFLTPFIGSLMTGSATNNSMTLMTTAVIKNEPYKFGS